MANIFTWDSQDIDLKECIKVKTNCQQNDTMVLQFKIYDYDSIVDLTNYNVTFVAKKPSGTIYGQTESENITKSSNSLTITCNSQLTAETGRTVGTIVIRDTSGNRKGSYFVVFNVFGILNDDDKVVSTNFVDILDRFDEDVAIALSLDTSFKANIVEAKTVADDLAIKVPIANSADTTLNNAIDDANEIESRLSPLYQNSKTISDKLDISIPSATTIRDELDSAKISANIDKDALITTIGNADTKLQEFKNYDTTQLVPLSNTMLNEMYCNKELLSINHGLNGYPIAKLTYTEFGGGVSGAGDFPAGADSDCNLMQNKAIYTDNNNMKIFVPLNYYITLPSINKINNHKYIVTFTNSTRSILIELIEGSVSEDIKLINKSISDLNYQNAQGNANTITLTINKTLTNGYALTFIASANNNSSATTINGKHLYKPNTTTSPTLIGGKAYTVWYNSTSDCFFIKASAEGNTIAPHVLAGDIFSTDVDTGLVGTLDLSNLVTDNIKSGITINGVSGKSTIVDTVGTNLQAKYMISGTSGYANGVLVNGNMPNYEQVEGLTATAKSYNSGQINVFLDKAGYYAEGQNSDIKITDANLIPENFVAGKKVFELIGTATVESLGGRISTTGTVAVPYSSSVSVNVSFVPSFIIAYNSTTDDGVYNVAKGGTQYIVHHFNNSNSIAMDFSGITLTLTGINYAQNITWIAIK